MCGEVIFRLGRGAMDEAGWVLDAWLVAKEKVAGSIPVFRSS